MSRGETSAAVLDALNYGVPLVVNANGAMADLPRKFVTVLADEFEIRELAEALEALRTDPSRRDAIGALGRSYIRAEHSPRHCADRYQESIERSYAKSETSNALLEESGRWRFPANSPQISRK